MGFKSTLPFLWPSSGIRAATKEASHADVAGRFTLFHLLLCFQWMIFLPLFIFAESRCCIFQVPVRILEIQHCDIIPKRIVNTGQYQSSNAARSAPILTLQLCTPPAICESCSFSAPLLRSQQAVGTVRRHPCRIRRVSEVSCDPAIDGPHRHYSSSLKH